MKVLNFGSLNIDFVYKIRQTGYGNKPIIAVTAHAMQGDREKFQEEGFDGYISKPINITRTLRVVEEMLRDFKSETAQ